MSSGEEGRATERRAVEVDLNRCVGHGKCYLVAPELLRPFDDDGHAEFYADPIDPADVGAMRSARDAIESCPEDAPGWAPARNDGRPAT